MRIAHFTDTFLPIVDGVGRVVYNSAVTLCKKNQECYVIAPLQSTGYRGGYPFELIEYVGHSVPAMKQYKQGVPALDKHYTKYMKNMHFDIVHANSPFIAGSEALRQADRLGIPLVGTFHSKYYDDFFKFSKSEKLSTLGVKYVVEFYNQCDEVWTVSRHAARVLASYGYDGDVRVVENGVEIHPIDDQAAARASAIYHLGVDTPVLLYVGQINWKKNLLRTLEAASLLRQEGFSFRLVMVGSGPDMEEIRASAQMLGVADITTFTGLISDSKLLDGLYRRASIFAFPSAYDTAGLVVREAAAMMTPSLVLKDSAPSECIVNGDNGIICEDTSYAMAQKLKEYLFDKAALERMGRKAYNTLLLSWDDAIDFALLRYKVIYEASLRGCVKPKDPRLLKRAYEKYKVTFD